MRVLVERGSGAAGKRVPLDDAEVHHLRVRRARPQESVEALDGAGLVGKGRLVQEGREWLVEIESAEWRDPPTGLILAVGAGDRDRFAWLVEKSAELGVTSIVPLETAHTASVATRLKATHLAKARQTALESLKQCGAAWAPTVEELVPLDQFLRRTRSGPGWLADVSGALPPAALDATPLSIVVGPEGGFSESERMEIVDAGFRPVRLGSYTLRFETAALVAAAAASQARLRSTRG
jgi:16S rRNA (uracil1498-N3)-methyltransferase